MESLKESKIENCNSIYTKMNNTSDSTKFNDLKKKNVHPKTKAGLFSSLFFCWGLPIFYKGWHREYDEDDLYDPLKEHESHYLGDRLEELWKLEKITHKKPKLWRALWQLFRKDIVFYGTIVIFMEFVLRLSQPLALGKLVDFYTPQQQNVSKNEAYFYAGFIVFNTFLYVIVNHSYLFGLHHLGMKMRVACSSLIYRKSLKLNQTAMGQTTVGQMINLLSNDVNRFDDAGRNFHYIWIAPLETALIMYLMYNILGITAITGFGLLFVFIPIQIMMGKLTSKYRLRTAVKTDERVRLMNEIISGIQVIKMYTWEKVFMKLVEQIRMLEIIEITKSSYLRALQLSFSKFITRVAIFLCIVVYALLGYSPNAEYVYVISSFYNILKESVISKFPHGIASLAEAIISMQRIETFLLFDEVHTTPQIASAFVKKPTGVYVKNGFAKWKYFSTEYSLFNINLTATSNELVAIVGRVGSGKTTLLQVILRELNLVKGQKENFGTISYSSQEPWLFAGTIKQNILFGEQWNKNKYDKVVKVCALERDFQQLHFGDRSLIGDRGVSLSGGQKARINLARAIYKDADIYLLDDPLSAVDSLVGRQLFEECIQGYLKGKCTILVTHQLQYLKSVDRIYVMETGRIIKTGTYEEIKQSDSEFAKLFKNFVEEDSDEIIEDDQETPKDYTDSSDEPSIIKEHRCSGSISWQVYKSYLKAGGGVCTSFFVLSLFIFAQIIASAADYFVSFWVNKSQNKAEEEYTNYYNYFEDVMLQQEYNEIVQETKPDWTETFFTTINCFYIYTSIIIGVIILTISRSVVLYRFCMKASVNLHNIMFMKVLNSNMKFFNSHPSGRILNKFSKDLGTIDEVCPYVIMDTFQIALNVIAVNLVIATVSSWILISTSVIVCLFYFYRKIYITTSRNLKRLEAATRSPVFSHINASLQGLTTIRAFGAQDILRSEFDRHQDVHSSAFYLFLSCNRTFGFWLDLHCVIYIALVTVSFFFMENGISSGNVGLAITQAMSLTGMFQWGMRQWAELENSMTSVERVVEYVELEEEDHKDDMKQPKAWPEKGCLQFQSVYLKYALNKPYILNNLTFKIQPMEKVGIVGRTGAGKSSLISALFRMAYIEGKILIDGVNTNDIPLDSLRSKISIIPQEPIIFSGTLRSNLDALNEHNDADIWRAIEQVHLKSVLSNLNSGLDSKLSEGGTNLSVGQKQLVCLARAIIRNNRVLVLDEATANVDPKTDALIQETIRQNFAHCTVLTIAHRLHTIMDSDKVLVMDGGQVIEFDHPYMLLQNHEGIFYKLVKETGNATCEQLTAIAKKSYELRKQAKTLC